MAELTSSSTGSVPGIGGKLGKFGASLLPLLVFIVAVLSVDWLNVRLREADAQSDPQPQTVAAAAAVSETAPEITFRDSRSLLDLIAKPAVGVAADANVDHEPQVRLRSVEFVLSGREVLPLGLIGDPQEGPGTYGVLRGVPQSAQLTHGISVGDESWLIDAADIPRVAIELRAGLPDNIKLEYALMAANGRTLVRETLDLVITAVAVPQATLAIATEAAPAAAEPLTSMAPLPVVPVETTFAIRLASGSTLVAGRGGLLELEIEPANATPTGSYIVLRGFPAGTALSAGIQVGVGSWLLSEAQLAGLEVRLPVRSTEVVVLDARLLSADGKLLAEHQAQVAGVADRKAIFQAAAVSAPVASIDTPPAALAAPVAEATRTAAVPALAAPVAPVAAAVTTASIPVTAPTIPTRQASSALARGRRMLDIGNIAMARPLLQRAADEGHGEAAALLAASFDPAWLKRFGVIGVAGDTDKAQHWYGEARRLGATDTERIVALPLRR